MLDRLTNVSPNWNGCKRKSLRNRMDYYKDPLSAFQNLCLNSELYENQIFHRGDLWPSKSTPAGMVKLRVFIKSLDITMKEHHFDGTDTIKVFQCRIHFVTKSHKPNKPEGQAYLALTTYLTGRAKSKFMCMKNGVCERGITCLPEAILFFLRRYPTPNVTRDVVSALQNVRQLAVEDELDYAGRLSTALSRCRNVNDETTIWKCSWTYFTPVFVHALPVSAQNITVINDVHKPHKRSQRYREHITPSDVTIPCWTR